MKYNFSIELCPPVDPADIESYYQKIEPLLRFTNDVCISSHPVKPNISGFDRSYNLAKFLLAKRQSINIMMHLTCQDVNRVNIEARLQLISGLGIKRLLLVSGQTHDACSRHQFRNSRELIQAIRGTRGILQVDLLAVGGYPECTDDHAFEVMVEKIRLGANAIITQCIFDAMTIEQLTGRIKKSYPSVNVPIIPSLAIFKDQESLGKVMKLIRVSSGKETCRLTDTLGRMSLEDQAEATRYYLTDLCRDLYSKGITHINICPFDQIDQTIHIMSSLSWD